MEEGQFLAGEYPGSQNPDLARRRIASFFEAGIRTFIDLTQPYELSPYAPYVQEYSSQHGMTASFQRFPIADHGVPFRDTMVDILDAITASVEAGKPVYGHCWGGVGRTGLVVGCYLIRQGLSSEQALLRLAGLYGTRPSNIYHPVSPETEEQFQFIRTWREQPGSRRCLTHRYCEG